MVGKFYLCGAQYTIYSASQQKISWNYMKGLGGGSWSYYVLKVSGCQTCSLQQPDQTNGVSLSWIKRALDCRSGRCLQIWHMTDSKTLRWTMMSFFGRVRRHFEGRLHTAADVLTSSPLQSAPLSSFLSDDSLQPSQRADKTLAPITVVPSRCSLLSSKEQWTTFLQALQPAECRGKN